MSNRYADRINMSVAVIGMADELEWTLQQRAQAMSAFFYGYCPTQVPAAIAVRRLAVNIYEHGAHRHAALLYLFG